MIESDCQKFLYKGFIKDKRHVLAVPNCKALYPRGESDLISVTEAGLVHEFEIKTSKSDYLREFRDKEYKHEVLEQSGREIWDKEEFESKDIPNYFWFATDRELCERIEVPEYAGLLCVGSSGVKTVKKAPRRHSEHITDRARKYLERGMTVRYWES
jgi:hypothetical protein